MALSDLFQVGKLKEELAETQKERDLLKSGLENVAKERDALVTRITETEDLMKHHQLKRAISALEKRKEDREKHINELKTIFLRKKQAFAQQLDVLRKDIESRTCQMEAQLVNKRSALEQEVRDVDAVLTAKRNEIVVLEDTILLQSFAFYTPKYDFENSDFYMSKLKEIRKQQEEMAKAKKAAYCTTAGWVVNDSKKEGERMVKDYIKILLRSFNNECDASIDKVKFNNIKSIEKQITKAFETLNLLGQRMSIVISSEYLNLKMAELYLCHEYKIKKQEEKEEQRRIREQMREEAKLQKEIEELKAKIEKEETHFNKALQLVNKQLETVTSQVERELLQNEIKIIENKLADIEKNKEDVQIREQNTRAGYVYIISNVGSFGEDVYKIGVTRRLDPQERVDELGDASVPFYFDVHAMIFSHDAPALENALHKAFHHKRLNKVNLRREFFKVNLTEIEAIVKKNFNKPVEFMKLAEAEQFRQSLMMISQQLAS